DGTVSGMAADWWNRAEEDFDRAAELGLNTLRLSVEWSRVEPEPGKWNAAALGRYREMLQGLRARGLRPMVTLHHFTNPRWLSDRGGWLQPEVVPAFARYAAYVASTLGDLCDIWCTLNEPGIYAAFAYILGRWPGETGLLPFIRVTRHQLRAHAAAYRAVREVRPNARVGLVQHFAGFEPEDPGSKRDRLVAAVRDTALNWRLIEGVVTGRLKPPYGLGLRRHPGAVNSSDYIGVNYYGRHPLRFDGDSPGTFFASPGRVRPERAWPAPWQDREIDPDGLERFLLRLARYGKPLYVTENGMADAEDGVRPAFILTHLAALHRAIRKGADVRGYYHWTLVDNYEWAEGWTTRFGLFALDPQTQVRTPRPSARLFKQLVQANAIDEDLVEAWAPEIAGRLFDA
ncbi:MAG TPA: family 1 glycosylhydrolase, partial [Vicinamibacteria bacterium]